MLKSLKCVALCLLMLLMLAVLPAEAESQTMLQLTFIGMYATSSNTYSAVNVSGEFDVYQNGQQIGTIRSDESGSAPFVVPGSGNVQLFPVKGTIPHEIPVNEQGYTVSIIEGQTNFAPIVTYAKAGLFRVHTESRASFELISEEGQTVMRFTTDSKGDYALPVAIPAGQYSLRMEEASLAITKWRDKIINVKPYTGPDSVVLIDASYYYTPEITLKPVTPTPVPTATLAPTPVVTATPAPTAAPVLDNKAEATAAPVVTATSVPTATPTPIPTIVPTATPTPVPTSGTVVLNVTGDEGANAAYSIALGGKIHARGELIPGEKATIADLGEGDYIVSVILPDGVQLTGLNGYPSLQRRMAQWLVSVSIGRTVTYQLEISRACALSGMVEGVEGVQIVVNGSENYNIYTDDAYELTGLTPDTYTVTAVLPQGSYTGEGWTFVDTAGQTLAITRVELRNGKHAELPVIRPAAELVRRTHTAPAFASGNDLTVQESGNATLQVQVFVDANNNGVYGKNEPMVEGAAISLILRAGGMEAVVAKAVTDENGLAVLEAPAGTYTLRCELPADFGYNKKGSKELLSHSRMEQSIDRVQEVAVTLIQDAENVFGIGAAEMSTLSGTIWLDANSDGLWQAEESGVEGILVTADGARNDLHYETTTDADGWFEIRQIRTGTYNVAYHLPDGYVFTYKANGPKQLRSIMTTEADRVGRDQIIFDKGETIDEQNIGLLPEAVIEGVCFVDANYNGLFDEGEEVLSGVQLELFRQSNNKRQRTVVTDETGAFRFGNIRSDVFKVKALLPKGMTFTMNIPGDAEANQFAPNDGRREQTVFNIGVDNGGTTTLMAGAISYGSVSGVVYYDDNFSGDWETGEKIAQGVLVTLLDDEGEAVKSAKTNKSGAYTFGDLVPGEYRIAVSAVSGYAFTKTGEGSIVENDGFEMGVSPAITLSLGENLTAMDAGMILQAEVSGRVFADANDNGLCDAGETGLRGTVVSLMKGDAVIDTAEVGADGSFRFTAVLPDTYYLRYELPGEAVFAPCAAGGSQIAGENAVGFGEQFEVGMGEKFTAPLCGGLYLGTISGTVFGDSDGSGVRDGDEAHLAGLQLTLTPARTDLSEHIIMTGVDGEFVFSGIRPGEYTLSIRCPEGYVLSQLPDVTLPISHGVNEQSVTMAVDMGAEWTEQQLGCVKPASYTGSAWLDENLNGLCDEGERPAAGERIIMIEQRTDLVIADMLTAEDGSFTAEGLAPGMYTLSCEMTDGMIAPMSGDSTFAEENGYLKMTDVRILEGTEESGALLGLVRETTLSGHVWLDSDGTIDMVSGAEVTLIQQDEAIASVVTGEDGLYTFDGLMPGEFQISVKLPERHLALEPNDRRIADGNLISILTFSEGGWGESGVITAEMAQHQLQLDIGSVKAGRLGDLCWLDLNGNGLQDYGEGGIPGVQIVLMYNGEAVAETVSDQYGYYCFEGLYPGEYTLVVTAPEEVKPTVLRTDMPLIVSVLTETGESILVPVESDGVNYAADLGFVLVNEKKLPAAYGEGQTQIW